MGKDFNGDDLSWLNPDDGDEASSQSGDDFPDLDWLTDSQPDDEAKKRDGGPKRTGVTGELPWLRDRDPADGTPAGDADEPLSFDWETGGDAPAKPDSRRLGVTGQLSWLQDQDQNQADEAAETSDRSLPDVAPLTPSAWRKASFEEQLDAAEQAAMFDEPVFDDDAFDDSAFDDDQPFDAFDFDALAAKTVPTRDAAPADSDDDDDVPDWLRSSMPAAAVPAKLPPLEDFDLPDDAPGDEDDDADSDAVDIPAWLLGAADDDDQPVPEPDDAGLPEWLADAAPPAPAAPVATGARTPAAGMDDFATLFDDLGDDEDVPADLELDDDFDLFGALTAETGDTADDPLADLLAALPERGAAPAAPDTAFDDLDLTLFEDEDDDLPAATSDDEFYAQFMAVQDDDAPQGGAGAALPALDDFDNMDWMRDVGDLQDDDVLPAARLTPVAPSAPEPEIGDLDSFLASLEGDGFGITDSLNALTTDVTLDEDLFDEALNEAVRPATPTGRPANLPTPDGPDWLAGVSVGEDSAAAMIRRQADRPLDELPESLLALREAADQLPVMSPVVPVTDPALKQLIPDLNDALPPAPVVVSATAIADKLNLSPAQAQRVALLTGMTASGTTVSPEVARAISRARFRLKPDRLAIALVLIAAVLLPFFGILQIGELPPAVFSPNSRQWAAYNQINSLQSGEVVIFAAEYSATAAGELDAMTDTLLRHVLLRGARPVIISSNPVGLLRAGNRVEALAGDTLQRNEDYYIGRYVAGAAVGLRGFSQDLAALTAQDSFGEPTGLTLNSLDDVALIIVVAENLEAVRLWSEQVAPLTTTPLIFATGVGASPLAAPYVDAVGGALVVGFRDTYTYDVMLNAAYPAGFSIPTAPPTNTPTITPIPPTPTRVPPTRIPTVTDADAGTDTGTDTDTDGAGAVATDEVVTTEAAPNAETDTDAAVTDEADSGGVATEAVTEPSATPEPTASAGQRFGTVAGGQGVNIRAGPGTAFNIVGSLQSGQRVEILGENEDGSWYNIRLDDALEGWVLAALIELETPGSSGLPGLKLVSSGGWFPVVPMGAGVPDLRLLPGLPIIAQAADVPTGEAQVVILTATASPTASPTGAAETDQPADASPTEADASTDEATPTVSPTATDTATPTATPTVTPTPTPTATPLPNPLTDPLPDREERWYAMTLGLVAIIVIIIAGNMLSLIRRAGRLRRSSRR